jgi:deoxyribonuclease-1
MGAMSWLLLALACNGPAETDLPADTDAGDTDTDELPGPAACEEAGYWPVVRDTPDADLADALQDATDGVSCVYSRAREFLFMELDAHDGGVSCVYTGEFFAIPSYPPDWDVVNTEHTWPQSDGADFDPAQCDLHHLYPSDALANTTRGSWPFGEVTGVEWSEGGSLYGFDSAGDETFEPRDDHKGNVARSMMYFATRYGYDVTPERLAIYRAWDLQDPADDAEIDRSLRIRDQQGNANPYVVCPDLVQRADP